MSDESAASTYTVTLKFGTAFNDPWVVIRGDSEAELMNRLRAFSQSGLGAVVATVARECHAVYNSSAEFKVEPVGGGQRQQQLPAPQQQPAQAGGAWPPGVQPKFCKHGEMIFKSGTKANGDPWAGAFCPRPKSDPDQCAVQWLKVRR